MDSSSGDLKYKSILMSFLKNLALLDYTNSDDFQNSRQRCVRSLMFTNFSRSVLNDALPVAVVSARSLPPHLRNVDSPSSANSSHPSSEGASQQAAPPYNPAGEWASGAC